jgi:hypothetical protein
MPIAGRCSRRIVTLIALLLAAVLPGSSGVARAAGTVTVSGTLGGAPGYTMNAVSLDGRAVSKRLGRTGAFRLRLGAVAARGATLQLIRPDGRYYGPVVLSRRASRAFLALAGRPVALGTVRLRGGYATLARRLQARALGTASVRTDVRGRPLGAGRLGLVVGTSRARRAQSGVGNGGGAGGEDPDRDGVPNAYDADDDGDLQLDSVDNGAGSTAGLFSTFFVGFTEALNANAGATSQQVDALFAGENAFNLVFYFDSGRFPGGTPTGAHVDCFTLVYCRRGDGTAILGGLSESSASLPRGGRWTDYDPDGSGYPNLERIDGGGAPAFVAGVQPRATTQQIRPGDTYNVVFGTNAGPVTVPTSLTSYFVTTPALVSYSSGGETTTVSYPIPPGSPGCCGRGDGSPEGNPIPMSSDRLTLTFWRPQRAAIPGAESGSFTDMGHLHYGVVPGGQDLGREFSCAGQYSGLSPTLTEEPGSGIFPEQGAQLFPLVDSGDDAAPSPDRTLSFTVDVGACLRAAGVSSAGRTVTLTLTAASASRPGGQDRAAQRIAVRLPG